MKRVGDLFKESWVEYKFNFKFFVLILVLLSFIPGLIFYFSNVLFEIKSDTLVNNMDILSSKEVWNSIFSSSLINYFMLAFFIGLLAFILGLWATSSIIYSVLNGKKKIKLSESLKGGLKYLWKYFLLSVFVVLVIVALIAVVVVIVGALFSFSGISAKVFAGIISIILFILLFLTVFYLGVNWVFAPYILIGEKKKVFSSLKSSRALVIGRWWTIFGYIALIAIILFAISLGFSIVSGVIQGLISFPYLKDAFIGGLDNLNPETLFPLKTQIILNLIGNIFNFAASLITIPLGLIFIKNFYFDLKKGKK